MVVRGESAQLAAMMHENIRGIDETIQYSGGVDRLRLMNQKTDALSRKQDRYSRLSGNNMAIANSLILISDVAMLLLSVSLYRKGEVSFEGVVVPLIALMSSFGPVTALAALGSTLQTTIASGSRVLDIIDEQPEVEDISGKEVTAFDGAALDHVSFAYKDETVLKEVSASFPENKIIGIVGKSGCGKSTTVKIVARLLEADSGQIILDGKDIFHQQSHIQ